MAVISYSMSGEGRGHAARARALVEYLRCCHRLTLYAPGDAYAFLAPLYAGTEVRVVAMDGLRFQYRPDRRLDYRRTLRDAGRYLRHLPALVAELRADLLQQLPDLVITDFEPALPRAARSLGIPFISLSHQHFLLTYDLSSLPLWLRWHTAYMKRVVARYYRGQRETIVSSFFFPPLRPRARNVTQTGVLLRPDLLTLNPEANGHALVYVRRLAGPALLSALRELDCTVRLYGLGPQAPQGNLQFRAIEETEFLHDLATCSALITTAGNQLVGEALYLRKPVFAMPEARNYEQFINAHFLQRSGAGEWLELEQVHGPALRRFMERLPQYRARIDPDRMNGMPQTLAAIQRWLPPAATRTRLAPAWRPAALPA